MHFTIFLSAFVRVMCKIHISNHCSRKHGAGPTVNRAVSSAPSSWKPSSWSPRESFSGPPPGDGLVAIAASQHKVAEHPWSTMEPWPARIPWVQSPQGPPGAPLETGRLAVVRSGELTLNYWISSYWRCQVRGRMNYCISKVRCNKVRATCTHRVLIPLPSLPPVRQAVSLTQWDVSTRRWQSRAEMDV